MPVRPDTGHAVQAGLTDILGSTRAGRALSCLLGIAEKTRRWPVWKRLIAVLILLGFAAGTAWVWPGPDSPAALLPLVPPVLIAGVVFDRSTGWTAAALATVAAYILLHTSIRVAASGSEAAALLFLTIAFSAAWLVERLHTLGRGLADAEARWRTLAGALPGFAFSANSDGAVRWVSPHWHDYSGASPGAAQDWRWADWAHPDDRDRVLTGWNAALASGASWHEDEFRLRAADGSHHWFLVHVARLPTGAWVGVCVDVDQRHQTEVALADSEARLLLAQEAARIGIYERDLVTGLARWSPAMFQVWGLQPKDRSSLVTEAEYADLVLPEDQAAHRARRAAMRNDPSATHFAAEYRISRADTGEVRWIASRGEYVRDTTGRAVLVRGTNHDVTERKAAEERQTLLMREVDHRAKNALAVVQAVLKLTPRGDAEVYMRAVEGRISALARAQTLLSQERWSGADLQALLEGELAPFRSGSQRILLHGPTVVLPPDAAQPLAMAAHELATNALKHGALSVLEGSVTVCWETERGSNAATLLRLRWAETCGPILTGPPGKHGFGTRVLDGTIRGQLGGTVTLAWEASGLICEMEVPLRQPLSTEPAA